jgi:hypothetical protein
MRTGGVTHCHFREAGIQIWTESASDSWIPDRAFRASGMTRDEKTALRRTQTDASFHHRAEKRQSSTLVFIAELRSLALN